MSGQFLIFHCPKILARGRMRRQNRRKKLDDKTSGKNEKKTVKTGKGCMLLWVAESPVDHCFCCANYKCKWCDLQSRKAANDVSRLCYRLCESAKRTQISQPASAGHFSANFLCWLAACVVFYMFFPLAKSNFYCTMLLIQFEHQKPKSIKRQKGVCCSQIFLCKKDWKLTEILHLSVM